MLNRREATAELLRERGDLLVVTGLGSPTYDVFSAGDHPANFYLWGAMGGAALVALGIAQAQPQRPVAAITGDGEQLMGMGGLATIAVSGARNVAVVVLDNGHFGETGGQRSHSGLGVDLAEVARVVGFPVVQTVTRLDQIEAARQAILDPTGGPTFVSIRITPEDLPRALPIRDGAHLRSRFRTHLGLPV